MIKCVLFDNHDSTSCKFRRTKSIPITIQLPACFIRRVPCSSCQLQQISLHEMLVTAEDSRSVVCRASGRGVSTVSKSAGES